MINLHADMQELKNMVNSLTQEVREIRQEIKVDVEERNARLEFINHAEVTLCAILLIVWVYVICKVR